MIGGGKTVGLKSPEPSLAMSKTPSTNSVGSPSGIVRSSTTRDGAVLAYLWLMLELLNSVILGCAD